MNREETIKLLALIKVAYPNAYKDMDKDSKYATINMWQKTYARVPYPIMEIAFDKFRQTSSFPPYPADINKVLKGMFYTAAGVLASGTDNEKVVDRNLFIMKATEAFSHSVPPSMELDVIENLLGAGEERKMLEG